MMQRGSLHPSQVFLGGVKGAWYDPSDFSTLFQDATGLIPVTATGQSVGKMLDKSGNGNHQISALNLPKIQQDTFGNYYIESDGTNDIMATVGNVDFTSTDKMSMVVAYRQNAVSGGAGNTIVKCGSIALNAGSFDFGVYLNAPILYRKGSSTFGARGCTGSYNSAVIASATLDLSGTSQATENPILRANGLQPALTDYGTANSGSGNFGNYPITLFSGQGFFNGRFYGAVIVAATLTTPQFEGIEKYLSLKMSQMPKVPKTFTDTGANTNRTNYIETSCFAQAEYDTSATSVEVATYCNIYTNFPTYANIGVYVDGVYNQSISVSANGSAVTTITLPAGNKRVSFVNGLQSRIGGAGTILGTWFVSARGNLPMMPVYPTATNRIVCYGDSITAGSDASPITQNAWAALVRNSYAPNSLALEAWGFRSLYEDAFDAPTRAALVARLVAFAPSKIWLAIGTNDYGLNLWTAANFGTAYAALLDDLHTALPSATIYCQTPILRTTETANGLGSTLGNYRTQIATAQSSRTSYAVLVDGTTFMTTASLADGVHPTTAGHLLYANAVRSVLGI